MHSAALILILIPLAPLQGEDEEDLRTAYDVSAYDLDWVVDPSSKSLEGRVVVSARATRAMDTLHLDCKQALTVLGTSEGEEALEFEHAGETLLVKLGRTLAEGDEFVVRVHYEGSPATRTSFTGFHWAQTSTGEPWVNTSCQGSGSHSWWPGKASYYHPEDKPDRVSARITVPADLYAVSNGRLSGTSSEWPSGAAPREGEWTTFSWRHNYPLQTYTVTLNVAPYVVVEQNLKLPGIEAPVPFIYYVLPESAEKAAVQFAQVPQLIEVYSRAFGPWPFPDSKIALVETNFWGMEHSTAVAYGSSFPAWCEENEAHDPYAKRNRELGLGGQPMAEVFGVTAWGEIPTLDLLEDALNPARVGRSEEVEAEHPAGDLACQLLVDLRQDRQDLVLHVVPQAAEGVRGQAGAVGRHSRARPRRPVPTRFAAPPGCLWSPMHPRRFQRRPTKMS